MLPLETLLQSLDIDVKPFAVCRVGAHASMAVPAFDDATIHYVLCGRGTLNSLGSAPIDLAQGTLVIVPRQTTHEIVAVGDGARMPVDLRHCGLQSVGIQVLEADWHGAGVVLACGHICATYQGAHGLFDYLPAPIVEHAKRGDAIRNAFATLVREVAEPQPGTAAMMATLIRQCLLVVLRKRAKRGICNVPWLSALEHPKLSKALRDILLNPGRPFTLELLAEVAGMSRSAFSEHFVKTFGRTAMEFVKQVRLRHAAQLLLTTQRPIKAISAQVGYHSRSHFTEAFKEVYGLHPAAYREHAGAVPPDQASQ